LNVNLSDVQSLLAGQRAEIATVGTEWTEAVEIFCKTLKSELVWRTVFLTRQAAEAAIGNYIDSFYNPVWRHSSPDFISPAAFERLAA
jgi:transposase InsO family protein